MKVGTKFKLECVVDNKDGDVFILRPDGVRIPLYDEAGEPIDADYDIPDDAVSDIREPRRRFTDVDGTEYEVLNEWDRWEEGDMMHNQATGAREKASFCVGSKVLVGPNYKLGLRRVKA